MLQVKSNLIFIRKTSIVISVEVFLFAVIAYIWGMIIYMEHTLILMSKSGIDITHLVENPKIKEVDKIKYIVTI